MKICELIVTQSHDGIERGGAARGDDRGGQRDKHYAEQG